MNKLFFPLCAAVLSAANGVFAEVKLDDCFGDNMVIQRELPARFRGTASPGEKVTLKFAGQTAETTADRNGDWKLVLAPLQANKTPRELTVTGANNTVTLKNVLVGEVWLCTGQSNMFYRVWDKDPKMRHKDSEKISAQADYPLIRTVMVTCTKAIAPERKSPMSWSPAVHDRVKSFSAVGYLFGVEIFKALDVPVGLVRACVGGTRIETWASREGFRSVPEGQKAADIVVRSVGAIRRNTPAVYYNAMIHPLTGMTVRGAIWYQGEQNRHEWYDYRWQMHALLNGWKLAFGNPGFQFHFVQIAPYRYDKEQPMLSSGLWQAQQQFADETGCGMAVVNDCGDPADIHPNDKRQVAHRLALIALNRTYGKKEVVCDAPRLAKWSLDGGKFVLTFKDAASWSTADGKPVFGFEVAGIDGKYFKADAKIDGAKIEVSSPQVPKPRYLRYLAHNAECGNLRNGHGLVPATFRVADPTAEEELKYLTGRDGLIYEYDLFSGVNAEGVMKPAVDNSRKFAGRTPDRLDYLFVFRTGDGKVKYVDIALAPFTKFIDIVGVPGSKMRRNIAVTVRDLRLRTNAPELIPDYESNVGNIEFFFTDYNAANVRNIRHAYSARFDSGDAPAKGRTPGYGCMQFHDWDGNPLFCFNNFKAGNDSDVGFGANRDGEPDWSFSRSGKNYSSGRLYVFGEFK